MFFSKRTNKKPSYRTLKKSLQCWASHPVPAVIQERRTVCIMRTRHRISAQRGLTIRGLNESAGNGLGIGGVFHDSCILGE